MIRRRPKCQEAMEQDHEDRDHKMAAAVAARPAQDRQENACARHAAQRFNINGEFRVRSKAAQIAGRT